MHLPILVISLSRMKLGGLSTTRECTDGILNKDLGALFKEHLQST